MSFFSVSNNADEISILGLGYPLENEVYRLKPFDGVTDSNSYIDCNPEPCTLSSEGNEDSYFRFFYKKKKKNQLQNTNEYCKCRS